jgi:hypothetical protein
MALSSAQVAELLQHLHNPDLKLRVVVSGHAELVDELRQQGFMTSLESSPWNPIEVVISDRLPE